MSPSEALILRVRSWAVKTISSSISAITSEDDRRDVINWFALVREVLNEDISASSKVSKVYRLMGSKKSLAFVFKSIQEAVLSFSKSNLPLPIKLAIPAAIAALSVVGGQSLGLAALGGAIGMPIILVVFVGVAGISTIIETFVKSPESRTYIGYIAKVVLKDEIARRQRADLRKAMEDGITQPQRAKVPSELEDLKSALLKMDPFEFERHTMSFFTEAGLVAWVTAKSNDFGIDGFARWQKGLIAVQCKRNSPENAVGRPEVQKFKGAMEEHTDCLLAFMVSTSRFTDEAKASATKNSKIRLVDMEKLLEWHENGIGDYLNL